MGDILRSWVLGLSGAAILGAFAVLITPSGPVRSVTKLLGAVILVLAFLSPAAEFDLDSFSLAAARSREEARLLTGEARELNERLSRVIIQEECAAYIWDKAQSLGLTSGQVGVAVRWGGDCWVPDEATLTFSGTQEQRSALANLVEAELGIPKERQHWNEAH